MPIQEWSENIWVAQVGDEPAFSEDLGILRDRIDRQDALIHVVIDLAGVTHINSSQLSQLLRVRKTMIDNDAQLRLASPNEQVWAVFLATGLDKVFTFCEEVSAALAQLQMGG